jgi:hypothetical protein
VHFCRENSRCAKICVYVCMYVRMQIYMYALSSVVGCYATHETMNTLGAVGNRGLFKMKYTLSKICFTKTTDAKSMFCVRMERKSLKVLISIIWSGASLRLWLLLPVTCCDEYGKSWILDLTSATSNVGLTSSACKVWKQFEISPFSLYIARRHMFNSTCKIHFWMCTLQCI